MATTFRIASFNLENLDDRPGMAPTLAERIAVLRPQLVRAAADVLCLQEVNGQRRAAHGPRDLAALDALVADTGYAGFARIATTGPGGGAADVHNLVILSRFPVTAWRQLRNDLVPAPRVATIAARPDGAREEALAWDRPLLVAELALPGGQALHVLDLHLRAPLAAFVPGHKLGPYAWADVPAWAEGFANAAMRRIGQALEARLLVDAIFDRDRGALIAVCGDFNAGPLEMPTRLLLARPDDTGNAALESRALRPVEADVPAARRFTVIHAGAHVLLDHILASPALAAMLRGVEIHNERLGDEAVAFAAAAVTPDSFHAPVVAEFALG